MDENKVFEAFTNLLASGDGIEEAVYWEFYQLFNEEHRRELDRTVDATDGIFYL